MRIIITGVNGYISKNLKKYINEKYDSIYIDLISLRDDSWKNADFSKYDAIIHAAALVHKKESTVNEQEYFKINTDLTADVAEKACSEGIPHFIFISTMSVYGIDEGTIAEDTAENPTTLYGKSKLAAEKTLLKIYSEKTLTILRPPMVYGPDCPGNFALLKKLARVTPIFPKVNNKRSMIYIENLCECILNIILQKQSGIFCPQNTEYICISDMVKEISDSLGKHILIIPGFNGIIKLLSKNIRFLRKVFGNLVYEMNYNLKNERASKDNINVKKTKHIANDVYSFEESVKRSVEG